MKDENWIWARINAANRAAGRCLKCGGGGVVADMTAIRRTGDPHASKRCVRCGGSGTIHPSDVQESLPHA